jgi:hypothetical protein
MQNVGVGQVIPIRSDSDELLNFVVGRKRFDRGIVRETHGLYGGIFAACDAVGCVAKSELGGGPGTFSIGNAPLELFAKYRRAG